MIVLMSDSAANLNGLIAIAAVSLALLLGLYYQSKSKDDDDEFPTFI